MFFSFLFKIPKKCIDVIDFMVTNYNYDTEFNQIKSNRFSN